MREASRSSSPSNQAPAAERRRRETGDFEPFPGLRVREDDVLRVQQESGVTREGRASAGRLDKDTCGNAGPTAILGPVGSAQPESRRWRARACRATSARPGKLEAARL